MNFRTLFIFAIVGLLLVSSLDAAKQKGGKGKGKSNEKTSKEEQEKKTQKDQQAVKAEKAKAENIAKVEKAKDKPDEAVSAPEDETPAIVRPKKLKLITAYDKCKLDCQKLRDQEDLHSYANQLREELAATEAALEVEGHAEEHFHAHDV